MHIRGFAFISPGSFTSVLALALVTLLAVSSASTGGSGRAQNQPPTGLDDRFFHPSAYSNTPDETSRYADLPTVDDKYLPPEYEGRSLNREEFAKVVLGRFVKLAAERGVPERGITRALFEGRLNPDFEDLTLAYEGLGKPELAGGVKPGETTPWTSQLRELYAQHRNKLWNQRFGSIADIGTVDTIVSGREVRRSADDILLRLYLRQGGSIYSSDLPRDFSLTYEQVRAHYQQHVADKLAELDGALRRLAESYSAYSYFQLDESRGRHFYLRMDYEELRARSRAPVASSGQVATMASARSSQQIPRPAARIDQAAPEATRTNRKRVPRLAVLPKAATCDGLAAHPEDKGRVGPGVADGRLSPGPAIEKCAQAAAQSPDVARLQFQLGRAYWAARRYDEALDAFLAAEEMGYAPAYFYLGQAFEQGLAGGDRPGPSLARKLYLLAAAEGFEPAVRAYQSMEEEPDFAEFRQPSLLRALYEGDVAALNRVRRKALLYVKGVHNFLAADPDFEGADLACQARVDQAVSEELGKTINVEVLGLEPQESAFSLSFYMINCGQRSQCAQKVRVYVAFAQQGTDDMHEFAYDYGTCEGEAVERVYATIKRFVTEKPAAPSQPRGH